MTYTATINVTTGIFKKTIEELNGHEEMTIQLPNTVANRALIAADQSADLVWSVGPVTLFEGTCTGAIHSRGMLDCIVYNEAYEILQRFQPFNTSYTATAASVILTALGAHVGIAVSWDPVPDPNVSIRFDYANPMDVLIALAESTGNDYWTTTGPLTIHIGVRGVARGAVATLENSRRTLDRAKQRNNVRIRGVDAAGNVIYGTANAGGATRYVTFTEKKPSDQVTLDALAEKKLIDVNKDTGPSPVSVSITVGNVLFPGDTVTLNEAHLQLVGDYRLWKVERFLDQVMIYPDAPDVTTDKAIWDTRKYEDLGIYIIGAGVIPLGMQTFSTNLQFVPLPANPDTTVGWDDGAAGNATIRFADGTTETINLGNSGALAAGDHWAYYTIGSNAITVTNNYANVDGPNKILLAQFIVPTVVAGQTQYVEIIPSYSRGMNIGTSILSLGVIITPDFRTAYNVGVAGGPAGIRITPNEIAGYSGGVTKEFSIDATTGKGVFGGGVGIIDSDGIHIESAGVISYLNFTIGGITKAGFYLFDLAEDQFTIQTALTHFDIYVPDAGYGINLQGDSLTLSSQAGDLTIRTLSGGNIVFDVDDPTAAYIDIGDITTRIDDEGSITQQYLRTDTGNLAIWMQNSVRDVIIYASASGAGNPLGPNLKLIGDVATSVPALSLYNDEVIGRTHLGSFLGDDENVNTYAFPSTYNLAYLTYDFTTDGVGARLWLGPSAGTTVVYDDTPLAVNWDNVANCTLSDETTIVHNGVRSLKIVVAGGLGDFEYDYGAAQDWSAFIGISFWWYGATTDTFKIVLQNAGKTKSLTKTFVDIVGAWGGREMFFTTFTAAGGMTLAEVRYVTFEDLTNGGTYYLDYCLIGRGSVTQFWSQEWWRIYEDEGVTESIAINGRTGDIYIKSNVLLSWSAASAWFAVKTTDGIGGFANRLRFTGGATEGLAGMYISERTYMGDYADLFMQNAIIGYNSIPITLGVAINWFAAAVNMVELSGDPGGNNVVAITGYVEGQEIVVLFKDGLVTMIHNGGGGASTFTLLGAANWNPAAGDTLTLKTDGTSWYEVSRSDNT